MKTTVPNLTMSTAGAGTWMTEFFGDQLCTKGSDGAVVKKSTVDVLADKDIIGIYFSAHWCPPCRRFTPMLGEAYKKITGDGKKFEIVFASSDRDEKSFDEYYGEMANWTALPYDNRSAKEALSTKYNVEGIPTLVLLDGATGETLNTDGVQVVAGDSDGAKFGKGNVQPTWRKVYPKWTDILANGGELATHDKGSQTKTMADLAGKNVIIYMSAHWCPPCRGFTPKFAAWYKEHAAKNNVEVVFCSSDRDKSTYDEYRKEMPWVAAPFGGDLQTTLKEAFPSQGIPHAVVVNADGEFVTTGVREGVMGNPTGFPWKAGNCGMLGSAVDLDNLNSGGCVLAFGSDWDGPTREKVVAAMKPTADGEQPTRTHKLGEAKFDTVFAVSDGEYDDQIKQLTGASDEALIYLKLRERKFYACAAKSAADITSDVVRDFFAACQDGSAAKLPGRS